MAVRRDFGLVDFSGGSVTVFNMTNQRRKENDDRRVIERVSSPHMRVHLRQLRWCLLFMTLFLGFASVYNVINIESFTQYSYNMIVAISALVLAVLFWRYHQAVLLFLENESNSNLDRVMERQSGSWIAIAFFAVFFAGIYFIFKT